MSEPVQLVCFDLGRVLVRICDGWSHACRVAGVTHPLAELDAPARARLGELIALSDTGRLDLNGFARAAGPALGLEAGDVVALSNAFLLGAYPGVDELLDELEGRGVATACLSNTNDNHWRMMSDPTHASALPLHRLTHRFASHLVGLRKPDAAIYEHVERETGVAAGGIVFFDDIAENVEAARGRGWRAFQIGTDRAPVGQVREHLGRLGVLT